MAGHLFVMHGDLTRLACDALVIPCDQFDNVNPAWKELLPSDRVSGPPYGWLHVSALGEGPVHVLPPVDGRAVRLVDTVGGIGSVEQLVDRALDAVRQASAGVPLGEGRAQPLIGLPLVGTGFGGLEHRRGQVARHLVERLTAEIASADFDVAIVAHDARDFAALQQVRNDSAWSELTDELRAAADDLGAMAARGELSLFLGAGASVPVGLPSWKRLLTDLAEAAKLDGLQIDDRTYLQAAEKIRQTLEDPHYQRLMVDRFDVGRYALSHGLLAGIGVRRIVTTNYDPCIELALTPVLGVDGYRVMTRNLAGGEKPWLLKLHGDIRRPETLVLTESEYKRVKLEGAALYGTVQGLMLTSHLLFIGFSLVDKNFLDLAGAVQRVRREAEDSADTPRVAGTALTLYDGAVDASRWKDDLRVLSASGEPDVKSAARRLEMFLDRLAWTADRQRDGAAQYLLDQRYDEGFDAPGDKALRKALHKLVASLPENAAESSGWPTLERALLDLGIDRAELRKLST